MRIDNPYHDGEQRVQDLVGERDIADLNSGGIGDRIVAPAYRFLSQLRFLVLGHADAQHGSEATVLFGPAGFLRADDDGAVLSIALDPMRDPQSDPVLSALVLGGRIGGLAIDLATRRRLRINGRVRSFDAHQLVLEVRESYANCPKYIQKRVVELDECPHADGAPAASGSDLGEPQRALIRSSDTLFVVSVHPEGDADASHRGGEPGFVQVEDDGTLVIPDYAGNSMFNTLGNLATNPRAALLFWDFEAGRLLHLAGRATLHLNEHAAGDTAERRWRFRTERWREQPLSIAVRLRLVERSPFNPPA